MDQKNNEKIAEQVELTCGNDELGDAKVSRGKKHNYLGTTMDYSTRGTFKVNVTDSADAMKEDFPCQTNKTLKAWNYTLFSVNANSPRLDKEKSDTFHTFTMRCMFLCKRGQPDVEAEVGFLSTCTSVSTQQDWNKLVQLLSFIFAMRNDILTLEADDSRMLNWYVNAAHVVHADIRSHIRSIQTMGKGSIASSSTK